jgi:hypothetical protein
MDPLLLMSQDPAEASVWARLMQNSSRMPAPGAQDVNNLAIAATQHQPALDKMTMAQAQRTPLPATPKPLMGNYSNASRAIASEASGGARKRQAQDSLDQLLENPEINQSIDREKGEIEDLKGRVKQYLDKPQQMDFSPLAALTDAWTGSNFSKNYQAPETAQDRAKTMAGLQNIIAQRQGDLTQQQLGLLRDKIAAKSAIIKADKEAAPYLKALQDRQDQSAHERILGKVKSDKTITDLFGKSRNIANAQAQLEQAKTAPPENFDEFQQTLRRNLGINGTSGLSERDKTMFDNLGLKGARAEQYLFGKPVDVRESQQQFFDHLNDVAGIIQKNNKTQIGGRLKALTAGNEHIYNRRQDLYQSLHNLEGATLDQFSPEVLSGGSNQDSAPQGAKPKMSFQDFQRLKREGKL